MTRRFRIALAAIILLIVHPLLTNLASNMIELPRGLNVYTWLAFAVVAMIAVGLTVKTARSDARASLERPARWSASPSIVLDGGRAYRPLGLYMALFFLVVGVGPLWWLSELAGSAGPYGFRKVDPAEPSLLDLYPVIGYGTLIIVTIATIVLGVVHWYGMHNGRLSFSADGLTFGRGKRILAMPWSEVDSVFIKARPIRGDVLLVRPKSTSYLLMQEPTRSEYQAGSNAIEVCNLANVKIPAHSVRAALQTYGR